MLLTRILTAIVLLGAIAAAASWSLTALQCLFGTFVAIAMYEWLILAGFRHRTAQGVAAVCGLCLLFTSVEHLQAPARFVVWACAAACVLWAILGLVVVRANSVEIRMRRPLSAVLSALSLGAGWIALASLLATGMVWLLSAMALVWIADIGAYFTGRALGRHKLAARISPGKTWEGVAGALFWVLSVCLAVHSLWPQAGLWSNQVLATMPLPLAALALSAVVALSIVGDLFESLLKRQAGVKDSGRLLPGHGGVLDRIDASLPALPAAVLIDWWIR